MKNLYVGNLPHATTEAELRGLFEAYGKVDRASLVTDRETGRSRGFGFVEMSEAGDADKAIAALSGKDFNGRALTVNEAKPKVAGGGGGGGRGPGGGGGRGGQRGGGGGGGRDDYQGHARQPREPRW